MDLLPQEKILQKTKATCEKMLKGVYEADNRCCLERLMHIS